MQLQNFGTAKNGFVLFLFLTKWHWEDLKSVTHVASPSIQWRNSPLMVLSSTKENVLCVIFVRELFVLETTRVSLESITASPTSRNSFK